MSRSDALRANCNARRVLSEDDIRLIREAVEYRRTESARLRQIRDNAHAEMMALQQNLSKQALAEKFDVAVVTIERYLPEAV